MQRKQKRGYAAIALHRSKTGENVGSVLRAAGCYGADLVVIANDRSQSVKHPSDTQKAWRHIPTVLANSVFDVIPYGASPVAVDLLDYATPLPAFVHPESAYYIFGPEDGTLPEDIVKRCRHKVFVPTRYCMNFAATANVILYDRLSKQ